MQLAEDCHIDALHHNEHAAKAYLYEQSAHMYHSRSLQKTRRKMISKLGHFVIKRARCFIAELFLLELC